jgi:hypothetical protein
MKSSCCGKRLLRLTGSGILSAHIWKCQGECGKIYKQCLRLPDCSCGAKSIRLCPRCKKNGKRVGRCAKCLVPHMRECS